MIFRLKPITESLPVSSFLAARDSSHFSMISRGKPSLKGAGYFGTFAESTFGEISYFYAADVTDWEAIAAKLARCNASLLILNSELSLFAQPQANQCLLFCAHPKQLFAELVKKSVEQVGAHAAEDIGSSSSIGRHSVVETGAVIGSNVTIGDHCTIHGNVTIGDNVVIKSGTVIGGAGFEFYKNDQGELCHFPHCGSVVIESDVYIGSNVVIDTAVFKQTTIRRGTKVDNLASIAHNVEVGEQCLIMANVSLAGSVKIGPRSRICLAASVRDGVTIGADSVIGMNACVAEDIPDHVTAYGVPAKVVEAKQPLPQQRKATRLVTTRSRSSRLIRESVCRLELDLRGRHVITEAATGHFAVTASIAALAGAGVQAIAADSPYGTAEDAGEATLRIAQELGVDARVEIVKRADATFNQADIVTNLGFVRPLDASLICRMRSGSVIPVMYDARELRPGEIDLDSCRAAGVRLVGTNEEHQQADILSYCGPLAVRLLMEQEIEIRGARIAVAGENFFTQPIVRSMEQLGADVTILTHWNQLDGELLASLDSLIYLDYWNALGQLEWGNGTERLRTESGASLLQFIGGLDLQPFREAGWRLVPTTPLASHRMWRTLAYLGPKPVIELHSAGLKAAELELRGVPLDTGSCFDGLRQPVVSFRAAESTVTR